MIFLDQCRNIIRLSCVIGVHVFLPFNFPLHEYFFVLRPPIRFLMVHPLRRLKSFDISNLIVKTNILSFISPTQIICGSTNAHGIPRLFIR